MKNQQDFKRKENIANAFFSIANSKMAIRSLGLKKEIPEILILTSYPPRECGIATYSKDLLNALNNKFEHSFSLKICALESGASHLYYPAEVKYVLNTTVYQEYIDLAETINKDNKIRLVLIQHEFGLFECAVEDAFLQFIYLLYKPVVVVFHTVLPNPNDALKLKIQNIEKISSSIVVMTKNAAKILKDDYDIPHHKIEVIAHGTHLVLHKDRAILKEKFELKGKTVLSTFGLLSSGKGIETTLNALPDIVEENPNIVFLIIGKTHPTVLASEGEKYRDTLLEKVERLHLQNYVQFINQYLPLDELLEYLQLTDIYLFTSKDPNQAVSGTFSYAMSCGCPIISTPIPHTLEVLQKDMGILIDFENSEQLAHAVNLILSNAFLKEKFSSTALQRTVPTAWENSAIAYAFLFQRIISKNNIEKIKLNYSLPEIDLSHVKNMTTNIGIIQFSKINSPDIDSGYTLDDNARALVALCLHYELTNDEDDLPLIWKYLRFIKYCQQPSGNFLNYVDSKLLFTAQNNETNLSDSNGRAIWALGFLISKNELLPKKLIEMAEDIFLKAMPEAEEMCSTRSMAFVIKGLFFFNLKERSTRISILIKMFANRLFEMFKHESEPDWEWFESYLTYANSILPEAMLYAWLETGEEKFKTVAIQSFDFLLSKTFTENGIKVISNNGWMHKGKESELYGEQPIDVAYTIFTLQKFYKVFQNENYFQKITEAFNWFLGNNHLHQIVYNPCTGGCYDGLEKNQINLNQGAESTLSYLIARLTMEKITHPTPHVLTEKIIQKVKTI